MPPYPEQSRSSPASWDDELENTKDREMSTFMYPDVSVTPDGKTARSNGDSVCFAV